MIWWDFSNLEFLIFFIIIIACSILIAVLIVTFSLSNAKMANSIETISREGKTIRIYIIDLKNNDVIYFTRNDIKNKKRITLSQFYLFFNQNNVDKLKNWIYGICIENRNLSDYIEVDIVSHRTKKSYYSILKKIKFDPKAGLLHLESHIMEYTSPASLPIKKNKGVLVGHVNKEDIKALVEKQKNLSGYTFCTRFFYKRSQVLVDERVERVITATLKNVVYKFALNTNKNRQIVDEPGNEIMLFDLALDDKEKAIKLAANMAHEIKKTLGIEGYEDSVGFAIGVIENAQYYQDFSAIYKTAQQACIYAEQHQLETYFYTRSSKLILSETGKYSQEISRLLKPNTLRYNFKAIINAEESRIIGYFNTIKAPESPFTNFMEISKYSAKVHRNKEFFAYVSKNVISIYASENKDKNVKLFMPVSLNDISFMHDTIVQVPQLKHCPLVLVFEERDFDEEEVDVPSLKHLFESLKTENIQLGLLMHDQNLLLDPDIYFNFDYFIVDNTMIKEIKKSKFIRLSIHTLVEQLLKYKKPIIASDVEGWQTIELVVNSGIQYISSETLSASSPLLLPLDKRKAERLKALSMKYQ
ncbi:MAG: hypothetical protein K5906_02010 [Bacilli bacterium]|nr:hypothetical protein [Bacilli bacterium]